MATQGPNYPASGATLANAGTSENAEAWVSPGNITSDNGTSASVTAATYDNSDITQLLVASNFGFSIPAGSTIDGITVEVDRSNAAGAAHTFRIQLATGTTFATLVGDNKGDATDWPASLAIATYGGAADNWNAGLTVAQVNATGFAVMLSAQADGNNTDVAVDFIRVTINYTIPLTISYAQAQALIKTTVRGLAGTVAVISGNTTSVTETFTRSETDSWGGVWTRHSGTASMLDVNGSEGTITTTAGADDVNVIIKPVYLRDTSVLFKFKSTSPPGTNSSLRFSVRRGESTVTLFGSYVFGIALQTDASIDLTLDHNNGTIALATQNNVVTGYVSNTYYRVRFEVFNNFNNTLVYSRARIWEDGTAEPSSWSIEATDSSLTGVEIAPGHVGLRAVNAASQTWTIDDVHINQYISAGYSQAQAEIIVPSTTGRGFAQAQSSIKQIYNVHAQAQSQIKQTYPFAPYYRAAVGFTPLRGWRVGEASGSTAVEITGNNNGTYVGTPTLGATGIIGNGGDKAITLDGSGSSYISTTWDAMPAPPASITVWIKHNGTDFTIDTTLAGSAQPGTKAFRLMAFGNGVDTIELGIYTEQGNAHYTWTPTDTNWHLLAGSIVAIGNEAHIYFDGVRQASNGVTYAGGTMTIPFHIGTMTDAGTIGSESWPGSIDDVFVYDRDLTDAEVLELYNTGFRATQGGTFAQSQAWIEQTYQGYAQAQASIISTFTQHAQAQAQIKQIYQGYSQAQSWIEVTVNRHAQAQADIKQTYFGFSQANAWIEQTYFGFAQANAWIEQTYNAHAQAQAQVKRAYRSHAQANAWIKQTYPLFGYTQIQDTFTESVNTLIENHTADIGGSWTKVSGTLTVTASTDTLHNETSNNSGWAYVTNVDVADAHISFNPIGDTAGDVYFRIIDTNNYYRVSLGGSPSAPSIFIYRITGGSTTQIFSHVDYPAVGGTYTFHIWVSGISPTAIKARINGTTGNTSTSWQAEITDNTAENQIIEGKVGVFLANNVAGDDTIDNFLVVKEIITGPFGQVAARIKGNPNKSAQAQARIKATSYQFSQAQAKIKTTRVHAQAQGWIEQTYFVHSQAQAWIEQTYNGFAQSQAWIEVTVNNHAQAQAWIEQTYNGFAQSQAWIEQTYNSFAQAQANIEQTYNAFAQAQASIAKTSQVYAQANAWIEQTYNAFAQGQAWIENTYFGHAQGQAWIEATYNQHAQAQGTIKTTYQAYAQAQAKINTTRVHSQANAWIENTYFGHSQANAWIEATYYGHAQAQANIENTYNAHAQAQGWIEQTYNQFAQAGAWVETTYNQFAQAQGWIEQAYNQHANAQAWIEQTYQGYAQGAAWIRDTYVGCAQAQTWIKATYFGHSQVQAKINAYGVNQHAQANAAIGGQSLGHSQAQAKINAFGVQGYGQAQGWIETTYFGFAQAQANIEQTYNVHAQAQGWIEATYFGHSQSNAWIEATYNACGNAQAWIKNSYQGYSQAQADIKAVYVACGQAQGIVGARSQGCGQAQGTIKSVTTSCGQAQGTIEQTYNAHAQSQGWIEATYQGYAQANAYIKIADIEGFAQAQAAIKATINSCGQSQGQIKQIYFGHAQAQGWIETTVINVAQAQGTISSAYQAYAQAEAVILSGRAGYAQAQALIKVIDINACAQAQAVVIKAAGYGQAQGYIRIVHFLDDVNVSDGIRITLNLSDRKTVTPVLTDENQLTINLRDSGLTLNLSDIKTLTMQLDDNNY